MNDTYLIVSNSSNIQNNNLGHIKVQLNNSINYPPDKSYKIELDYLKVPYSVCNISSAKNNNVLRYVYSSTTYTITFLDGVYTSSYLSSYVQSYLASQNHFDTDLTTGNRTYYFELGFNNAVGKSYIQINKTGVQILDTSTSTFYQVIGFSLSQFPFTTTTLGNNLCDISQGTDEVYLYLNIAKSNYNQYLGGSDILYNSNWSGSPWTYNFFPLNNERNVCCDLAYLNFNYIEIRITDKNNIMTFSSDTSIDNLVIRFTITDEH
jgi:hypothetical protein